MADAGEPALVVPPSPRLRRTGRVHDRLRDCPHDDEGFDKVAACCRAYHSCCCCCCCYCYGYCCCRFLGLVEDVVRFGRLTRIAVTLGSLGLMREAEESRDDGHEHRKGAQRRCDPVIAERG